MYFQPEYNFHCKSDCTQSSVSSYMHAVYPTSYPVAAAGYPGVYCDFGLYPYPVAYRRVYDDDDYYAYDRRYTAAAAAAAATQRLRSYYGGSASSRSAYELSPSPPSPGVATGHQQAKVPSSCRLVSSSESADKMASYVAEDLCRAETSIAEVATRNHVYAGYTGNGSFPPPSYTLAQNVQQRRGTASPTAPRTSPSSSCAESGLKRAAAVVSSPAVAADCAPVNLAGVGNRWTERRTVIMGDVETTGSGGGHHQSVICRASHDAYDPTPTVADSSQQQRLATAAAVGLYDSSQESNVDDVRRQTSAIQDSAVYEYHRRLKAAAASQAIPGVYSSHYCASQLDHTAAAGSSPTDDDEDVEETYTAALRQQLPGATGARPYFRVGCAAAGQQQQRRLQHHVPTGNHVTGYTSVIVDTQQLHANGYVH